LPQASWLRLLEFKQLVHTTLVILMTMPTARNIKDNANLCQIKDTYETGDGSQGPDMSYASPLRAQRLVCSRIILSFGLVFLVDASPDLPRPRYCCSSDLTGRMCLPGDPNGVCCGNGVALWCGAGSTCYTNGLSSPYCCAPNTVGCRNVCLDFGTARRFIESGGSCNPVAPQGFNADGRVLPVEAPWQASTMSYRLDGNQLIFYPDPPIRLGMGDFTMMATITPRTDGIVGFPSFSGDEIQPAVLYMRERTGAGTGYVVRLNPTRDGNTTATVVLGRDAGVMSLVDIVRPTQTGIIQVVTVNISNAWRANVPVAFRVIRQGLGISVFVNNSLADVVPEETVTPSNPVDVDTGLGFDDLLFISPVISLSNADRIDLNANVADMSVLSSAHFP